RRREQQRLADEAAKKRKQEEFEREHEEAVRQLKGVSLEPSGLKGISSDAYTLKGIGPQIDSLKGPGAIEPGLNLNKPVDPRVLVTASLYESAKRKLIELRKLEAALISKQSQL